MEDTQKEEVVTSENETSEVSEGSHESSERNTSTSKKSFDKTIIAIVAVVVLIVGALEFTGTTNIFGGGKALATVNGEKVTQAQFDLRLNQVLNSDQAQSIGIDDPIIRAQIEDQILNEIINTRILLQQAAEAGIEVTAEEVQAEYDLIVARLGDQETLNVELKNGGLTEKTFRDNIEDQIRIQKYLELNIDQSAISATEEEIVAFYEQVTAGQDNVPGIDEIRTQLEGQIISQKQQQVISDFILKLRENATIEIAE